MKKVTYVAAMKIAIARDWFGFIETVYVRGSGFTITLRGLLLLGVYALCFCIRALVAVLFPITAIAVMYYENEYKPKRQESVNIDP